MPTRFFCCLMFAIRESAPTDQAAGRRMVAEGFRWIDETRVDMSELDPSFDQNVDPALAEERAHRRRLARSTGYPPA